ncbi:serine/threonine-protein kinase [Kribbella pratensis]|uniref:Protein kinase-like protein n=1 Tax=Kribbella pratensis TaxID=2512112 RepID=A0A4R8CKG8_9ACTN|nr:protein kinase [Kribbella pratensis]TDW75583.1 protein kinase-like protein [Kribbella pratensis]
MDLADFTGYSPRRQLGSGPAGTVWQVRDRTTGRNAVLKQIPITAVPDLRRLREDLSVLSRIRHPHIARVMEFRETETHLIVISQYLPAGSLARLLSRRGHLSRGELVTLLAPLAEAVSFLHRSHLSHGAITPHNVLLDADGRPVLTDAALHPAPPATDLTALAALAHQAGADPTVFAADLFTNTAPAALPRELLSLAAPTPIDLAVRETPTSATALPKPSGGPDLSTLLSAPRPKTSDDTPGDDDPIALSRGPLAAPPPKPPTAPPTPPVRREQSATPTGGSKRRPNRRTKSRRGRVLRRRPQSPHTTVLAAVLATIRGLVVRRLVVRRLVVRRRGRRPLYGTVAAAGLGAVVVLAIATVTIRTLDAPATAQADPVHPQITRVPAATVQPTAQPEPTATATVQPTGEPEATAAASVQPTGQPETTAAASGDPAAWTRTLQALDAQRAHAFWTLDLGALDRIYVPGSSPWRSDHALLSSYREQQIRVEGLRVQIDSSTIARRTPTTVTLKTTDHLSAGQAVDQTGAKTQLPRGAPTTRLITLTTNPTTKVWRITAITQA